MRWRTLDMKQGATYSAPKIEGGPGNRLWPPTNRYFGMAISGAAWCACATSILLFDTACPLTSTLALSGWLVYPIPPGGLGSTATGYYGSNRIQACCKQSRSIGLTPQRLVEDPGTLDLLGSRHIAGECFYRSDVRKESIAGFSCSMFCSF